MREIKFRAWDKKSHKMMYPEDYDFIASDFTNIEWDWEYESYDKRLYLPEDGELMQYTGLLDKQGKEIYEGDILGGTWGDGYIGYCDKCKSLEYFGTVFGCMACEGDVSWSELVADDGKLEVIGNIYENSELLKEFV